MMDGDRGGVLGHHGVYIDPSALPLRDTVALVRDFDASSFDSEPVDEPKFGGIDPRSRGPLRVITLDGEFLVDEHGTYHRMRRDPLCPPRVLRRMVHRGNVVFPECWKGNGGGGGNRTHVRSCSAGTSTCVAC